MYSSLFSLGWEIRNCWSLFSDPNQRRASCEILSSVDDRELLFNYCSLPYNYYGLTIYHYYRQGVSDFDLMMQRRKEVRLVYKVVELFMG